MARTTGPLFGLDALGNLAGNLTYSKVLGARVAKRSPRKRGPPTRPERSARTALSFLQSQWNLSIIPNGWDQGWVAQGARTNVPGYNAFLSTNLQRIAAGLGPIASTTPTGFTDSLTLTSLTATTFRKGCLLNFTSGFENNTWGILFKLLDSPFSHLHPQQYAAWNDVLNSRPGIFNTSPILQLQPGSIWYADAWSFDYDGTIKSAFLSTAAIVIP
jgi:hypothetical protein